MTERERERIAALTQYSCVRRYSLMNSRFHKKAEMTVRMTYSQPGRKSFEVISEQGSLAICERVLRKMFEAEAEASRDELRHDTQITPDNYDFELAGIELRDGRRFYVLSAAPKKPNKFMMRGRVWVDDQDFAITRVEGAPAQNPSLLIHSTEVVQQYQKSGPFWLPLCNRSHTDSFLFGRTEVSVDSTDYRVTRKGIALNSSITPP